MRESDRISGIQSPSAFCRRAGPYSVHQVPLLLLSLICPRADRTAPRNTCQRYPNRLHRRRNARNTRPRRLMSRREPSDFPLPKHSLSTLGAQYLNTGPHTLTKSVSCCPVTVPPLYGQPSILLPLAANREQLAALRRGELLSAMWLKSNRPAVGRAVCRA